MKKWKQKNPATQRGMHLNQQIDYYEKDFVDSLGQYKPIHHTYKHSKTTKEQMLKTLELKTNLINHELHLLRIEKKKERFAAQKGLKLLPHEKKSLSNQKMIHFIDTYHDGLKKLEKLKEKHSSMTEKNREYTTVDRMI